MFIYYYVTAILHMTSEGLWEMFEGDLVDTFAEKLTILSMGGRAESLACIDLEERTPISVGGYLIYFGENISIFTV